MEQGPLIRDLPSFRETFDQIKALKTMKVAAPLLRPVLKLLHVDTDKIEEALSNVEELERQFETLASVPDRFNDLFADVGWIVYDLLNLDAAMAAVHKAESGDFDGAEADLTSYYTPDTVTWKLRTMYGVKAFRPRMELAEKALADYREGRYHACIPLVLALLDGMVNEANEERRGFFADDVNLEAWDSIAGHSKGLAALARIFRQGRYKTTTERTTIPYRNGIMHGMDLGWANEIVAAKVWAALFAARDWVAKAEKGELSQPPPQPKPGIMDTLKALRDLNDDKRRLAQWKKRPDREGDQIPTTEDPAAFEDGSPERLLAQYLSYWKSGNYGFMARCLSSLTVGEQRTAPARVRGEYGSKRLISWQFVEIMDEAPAISEIQTGVVFEEDSGASERSVRFRMINEDQSGGGTVRGKPGSSWKVLNWNVV